MYYANFIGGWLGFFTAPEVLQSSGLVKSWPGVWKYRWGDQQYWTRYQYFFFTSSGINHWKNRILGLYAGYKDVVDLSFLRGRYFSHSQHSNIYPYNLYNICHIYTYD